jgi:rhamnosyltransferase
MVNEQICAVVVTYHPDDQVAENLAALRQQVQAVMVVDNGSSGAELERLRSSVSALDCNLIENGTNLGIAAALNQGVRWAIEHQYQWVALFDQDSKVVRGYMHAMLEAGSHQPAHAGVALLVPKYIDRRFGHTLPPIYTKDGNIALAMTSGSLMRTTVFEEHGWFREELFIGAVDYEYSLRLRSHGKVLQECPGAVLLHAPSMPEPVTLFGKTLFYTSAYGPLRRYYAERNRVYLLRQYGRQFPAAIYGLYLGSAKEFLKVLLGEADKWEKTSSMVQGLLDGLRRRMGERVVT